MLVVVVKCNRVPSGPSENTPRRVLVAWTLGRFHLLHELRVAETSFSSFSTFLLLTKSDSKQLLL